eukprot:jgi/Bigna1/75199/fgenesh1_pg.33_\
MGHVVWDPRQGEIAGLGLKGFMKWQRRNDPEFMKFWKEIEGSDERRLVEANSDIMAGVAWSALKIGQYDEAERILKSSEFGIETVNSVMAQSNSLFTFERRTRSIIKNQEVGCATYGVDPVRIYLFEINDEIADIRVVEEAIEAHIGLKQYNEAIELCLDRIKEEEKKEENQITNLLIQRLLKAFILLGDFERFPEVAEAIRALKATPDTGVFKIQSASVLRASERGGEGRRESMMDVSEFYSNDTEWRGGVGDESKMDSSFVSSLSLPLLSSSPPGDESFPSPSSLEAFLNKHELLVSRAFQSAAYGYYRLGSSQRAEAVIRQLAEIGVTPLKGTQALARKLEIDDPFLK